MNSTSVTGGGTEYDQVVIMLHGGGGSGSEWEYDYKEGHFGDINRMKFVFPTSPMTMEPREHHMFDSVKHFFSSLNPWKPK